MKKIIFSTFSTLSTLSLLLAQGTQAQTLTHKQVQDIVNLGEAVRYEQQSRELDRAINAWERMQEYAKQEKERELQREAEWEANKKEYLIDYGSDVQNEAMERFNNARRISPPVNHVPYNPYK